MRVGYYESWQIPNLTIYEFIRLQIEAFSQVSVDVEIRTNFIVEMQKNVKNHVESTIGQDPTNHRIFVFHLYIFLKYTLNGHIAAVKQQIYLLFFCLEVFTEGDGKKRGKKRREGSKWEIIGDLSHSLEPGLKLSSKRCLAEEC